MCLLVACSGPSRTVAVWLEGPPLKQGIPKASSPASESSEMPAAPPPRLPASHVASHSVGDADEEEGGVTSQIVGAQAEPGGWRGVLKVVNGLPEKIVKLVEKGAHEVRQPL